MVKAAGHNSSVTEDTKLVFKAVAENFVAAVFSGKVRPVEFVAVIEVYAVADSGAHSLFVPWLREIVGHGLDYLIVFQVASAAVPKAVADDDFALCRFAEREALVEIIGKGHGEVVCLERVERNIHFVQPGRREQSVLQAAEESSVGGEDHFKVGFVGESKELLQMRVTQGRQRYCSKVRAS